MNACRGLDPAVETHLNPAVGREGQISEVKCEREGGVSPLIQGPLQPKPEQATLSSETLYPLVMAFAGVDF